MASSAVPSAGDRLSGEDIFDGRHTFFKSMEHRILLFLRDLGQHKVSQIPMLRNRPAADPDPREILGIQAEPDERTRIVPLLISISS